MPRVWLVLPALTLYSIDITLTLLGQPAAYWAGDYSQAVEHNPLAYQLLSRHPGWFIGLALPWALIFSTSILRWTARPVNWLAVLLALGHAIGASTWLARHGPWGWALAIGYLITSSWFAKICWRRAGWLPGSVDKNN